MTETQATTPQISVGDTRIADPGCLSVIIASAPGVMAQSLRVMMESMPLVRVVGMAAGCLSALQMVRDSGADLVVIDANLPIEDVQMLLQELRNEGLPTRSLVLASTRSHARRALAAGRISSSAGTARPGNSGALLASLNA